MEFQGDETKWTCINCFQEYKALKSEKEPHVCGSCTRPTIEYMSEQMELLNRQRIKLFRENERLNFEALLMPPKRSGRKPQ